VTIRTLAIAVAVTVIDVAVAIPLGFYMAKIASRRTQQLLVVAVLLPLWASYLVKAYAWRSVLADHGIADWLLAHVGASSPGYGITATIITLSYLWLPYVVLPVYTGFNKIPDRLLEASTDLGARTVLTMRAVIGPLMVPSIVAGSVFAFSLSLGDYIAVGIVGGANQVLGNLIYTNVGAANNLPLAAAIALVPIFIIGVYLALAGRAGALGKL
jgi:putative spermidine/putrescine transport system permease protein